MEFDETTFVTFINPNYFPGKLWRLVNDPQIRSICWDASGEGILIHQQPFEAEVLLSQPRHLSEYFRTTDFISFVRQLNLYGFRKKCTDRDVSDKQPNISSIKAQLHHFYNPYFKRDKPELLLKLKRLTRLNRAKLAGIEVTNRKPKHFHDVMLNSPQETSALMKTGSVLLGRQGTPYHHPCNGPQQEKRFNTPHHSQHGFYIPVNQCRSPDFLDSKVPSFQQPAASYSPCGYYPDYSVGYAHLIDQDPYWKAGDIPESRTSDMKEKEELDDILNLVEELQAEVDARRFLQLSVTY
ncbi:heat shock factor protein 5-like isoform X2 [Ictalurus punctatus]|uniref:Heat shock factor protein 5-like isoform X2 n=1 Tax=Ictalurus punctatus TaxID=7998 RepID=A0A9F7TF77_ICTPU|nr:heat shock factor protein 5-like isoform X2 [Ictalurus punctatus]XP_053530627.1 heat shock factor protein 5-like isoform X2 [Ictalurus punctatus]